MASIPHQPDWNSLFSKHLTLLEEHLQLWTLLQQAQHSTTDQYRAAQTCIDRTKEMMQHAQIFHSSFHDLQTQQPAAATPPIQLPDQTNGIGAASSMTNGVTGQGAGLKSGASHSRKRQREEDEDPETTSSHKKPAQRIDDLFTIDTDPTPIQDLLSQLEVNGQKPSKNQKRPFPKPQLHPLGASKPDPVEPAQKRQRRPDDRPGVSHHIPPQEHRDAEETQHADAFMAKVNKRHQEKEEKRKNKLTKKRKRDSSGSIDENSKSERKKRKKEKEKQNDKAEATTDNTKEKSKRKTSSSRETSNNRDKSKKKKHKK